MPCDTIQFKVYQDPNTKIVRLEVYRPYGINDEWMRIDYLNDMTVDEILCLKDYLIYIINKSQNKGKT